MVGLSRMSCWRLSISSLLRGGVIFFLFIIEDVGKHVSDSLTLGVAHGIDGGEGAFGKKLMLQVVAPAIAPDDAQHFPVVYLIEELTARDAYLAHEQLVDVVGGCQFFPFFPFPSFGFGSSAGTL